MKVKSVNLAVTSKNRNQVNKNKSFGSGQSVNVDNSKNYSETSGSMGKVEKNSSTPLRGAYYVNNLHNVKKTKMPHAIISFGGKNKDQFIVVTAEMRPYANIGGVSTVIEDYKQMLEKDGKQRIMVMPYYNGRRIAEIKQDNKGNEEASAEWSGDTAVCQFPQGKKSKDGKDLSGKYFFTNVKLEDTSLDDIINRGQYNILEKVDTKVKELEMGDKKYDIGLYRVEGTNHYMVYSMPTARMRKAYEDDIGAYSSSPDRKIPDVFEADSYAVFAKAASLLLPDIKEVYKFDKDKNITERKQFDPGCIICNDAQTAYLAHYVAQEHEAKKNPFYEQMNINYVVHNAGKGYINRTSFKKMAVNLGNIKNHADVEEIKKNPEYQAARKKDKDAGNEEEENKFWIKKFFGENTAKLVCDGEGIPNALSIALQYTKSGLISRANTVSEAYAWSFQKEDNALPHFKQAFEELDKNFIGVLNGLDSAGKLDPTKRVDQIGYACNVYEKEETIKEGDKEVKVKKYYTSKEVAKSLEKDDSMESIDKVESEDYKQTLKDNGYTLVANKFRVVQNEFKGDNGKTIKFKFDVDDKTLYPDQVKDYTDNDWEILEEQLKDVRAENRLNLFKRFIDFGDPEKYDDNARDRLVTGIINRPSKMIGKFDLAKMTGLSEDTFKIKERDKNGIEVTRDKTFEELKTDENVLKAMKDLHVTVSWGRGDLQKGIDDAIEAWMQVAQRDDKAVLIVGAEFINDVNETERVQAKIKDAQEKFAGRFVYLNSFAPANAVSLIADNALFPSRFAPCELTDLEAMKYGAVPIVTNIQGLKQKNFDPELDKKLFEDKVNFKKDELQQTSYRTYHNFNMMTPEVLQEYDKNAQKAIEFLERYCLGEDFKVTIKTKDEEGTEKEEKVNYIVKDEETGGYKYNSLFKNENLQYIIEGRDKILEKFKERKEEFFPIKNANKENQEILKKQRKEIKQILRSSMEIVDSGYTKERAKLFAEKEKKLLNEFWQDKLTSVQEREINEEIDSSEGGNNLLRKAMTKITANELALAQVRQLCSNVGKGNEHNKIKMSHYNMNIKTDMDHNEFLRRAYIASSNPGVKLKEEVKTTAKEYKAGIEKDNKFGVLFNKDLNANFDRIKAENKKASDKDKSKNILGKIKEKWNSLSSGAKWGIGVGAGTIAAASIAGGIYAGVKAHQKKQEALLNQQQLENQEIEDVDVDEEYVEE